MSRNIESIRLYRDIIRASKYFHWRNEAGESWSNLLKKNARKEFEEARLERDPLIIARLLLVGRDCLNQSLERLDLANKSFKDNIDKTRQR